MEVSKEFLTNTLTTMRQLSIREQGYDAIRNYNFECGYPDSLEVKRYKEFYDRWGIATRAVQIWPLECWQVSPNIFENKDTDSSEFESAFKALQIKLSLFAFLNRIDILSGIGRYGILFMGFNDGKKLSAPFTGGKDVELLYLRAFDESVINIVGSEGDPSNSRYGRPIHYNVTVLDQQGGKQQTLMIHNSRVLHVADNREADETFGIPRLQPIYNHIHDMRKIGGGSAEMFWKGGFPGTAITLDPKLDLDNVSIDTDALKTQIEKYSEGLQRYMVLTGAQATNLMPNVADPQGHFDVILKQISIAIGVPQRVLLGTEAAKLSSVQDKKTWHGRVKHRQNLYLTPHLVRPLIDQFIEIGILPEPVDGYRVEWPDIEQPSEEDRIDIGKKFTEAIALYVTSGAHKLMPPSVYFKIVHKFDDADIKLIEEHMEELPEPTGQAQTEEEKAPAPGSPEKDNSKLEL